MLDLKGKWYGGIIKDVMEKEIKEGTYLQKTIWIYNSSKDYCCFVDKNDDSHRLNIDANQAEYIKELREYGVPTSKIRKIVCLDVSEAELNEFITENISGNLDSAFKFISNISVNGGLVNHKNRSKETLHNKELMDFKIIVGE